MGKHGLLLRCPLSPNLVTLIIMRLGFDRVSSNFKIGRGSTLADSKGAHDQPRRSSWHHCHFHVKVINEKPNQATGHGRCRFELPSSIPLRPPRPFFPDTRSSWFGGPCLLRLEVLRVHMNSHTQRHGTSESAWPGSSWQVNWYK